jgi:hypothetical protein
MDNAGPSYFAISRYLRGLLLCVLQLIHFRSAVHKTDLRT